MAALADVLARQAAQEDSLIGAFEKRLRDVVRIAQARLIGRLQKILEIDAGNIIQSAGNQSALGLTAAMWQEELRLAGYNALINAFTAQFPGQLPRFHHVLEAIAGRPLPAFAFDRDSMALFATQAVVVGKALDGVVEVAAAAAQRQALFSVGGLSFTDLTSLIGERFEVAIGEARTLAATSLTTFYRTVSDRGFQLLFAEDPTTEKALQFKYEGPRDKLTRPFCARLLASGRSYTREQIVGMSNGQIPNPMVSAGGFNCRHQWIVAKTPEEVYRAAQAHSGVAYA